MEGQEDNSKVNPKMMSHGSVLCDWRSPTYVKEKPLQCFQFWLLPSFEWNAPASLNTCSSTSRAVSEGSGIFKRWSLTGKSGYWECSLRFASQVLLPVHSLLSVPLRREEVRVRGTHSHVRRTPCHHVFPSTVDCTPSNREPRWTSLF